MKRQDELLFEGKASALLVAYLHILSLGKLCLVQKYKTGLKGFFRG